MPVENEEPTDELLLQQYVLSRNQEAFAALVRRYGPMVWGVCRRIVRHTQDAEDALQATFAVLATKARSIRRHRTIGGWLHQVARRIALRARSVSNRRNALIPTASSLGAVERAVDKPAVDLADVLDDEIEGDTLRIAGSAPGTPRPEGYKTGPNEMSWVFRRARSSGAEAQGPRLP